MTSLEIYLIMQADSFAGALCCSGVLLGFATMMVAVGASMESAQEKVNIYPFMKKMAAACMTCIMLTAICPTTKTLAAVYAVPRMTEWANSDEVSAETRELYSLAKQALEKTAGVEAEK